MKTSDKYDRDRAVQAFRGIARQTITNSGGTFRRDTGAVVNPEHGYTVGVGKIADGVRVHRLVHGAWCDIDHLTEALAQAWPTSAPATAQYVGMWVDDGLLYVDHVVVLPTLDLALACAERYGELAVYDNEKGEAVYLAEFRR